jgi:hypothetical protein
MHPIICRVLERHPDVWAVCFADNVYLVGRASLVLPAQVDVDKHLLSDLGVDSKPSESFVFAPIWGDEELTTPPQSFYDLVSRVAPELVPTIRQSVRTDGIPVLGCPLGTKAYVWDELDDLERKIAADFVPCAFIDDGVAFYQLVRFCIMSRLTYTLRTSFPELAVRSAKALDGHCLDAWRDYVGWGRSAEAPNATEEEVTSWTRYALFADTDKGWYGMPSNECIAEAAYHSASVRFIAWLAGPRGPAVRCVIDEVFLAANSSAPSLLALDAAQKQLIDDGAQDGGDARAAPVEGVASGPILVPLNNIRETVRLNAALLQGGMKDSILFATQASLSKLSLRKRGPGTCLASPLPPQVTALALTRQRVDFSLAPTPTDESCDTIRTLCREHTGIKISHRPMGFWGNVARRLECQTLNREATSTIACMQLGMVVRCCAGPPGAARPLCAGCGKTADLGGHHFMTCNKRAAFNAAHTVVQEHVADLARGHTGVVVSTCRRNGMAHEKPVDGKKPDIGICVVHAPTDNGPRLHAVQGVSQFCVDFVVTHPLTGEGVLIPDAVGKVIKAKLVHHEAWTKPAGLGFLAFACSTLGVVSLDALRFLFILCWLIAEIEDKAAVVTAGSEIRGLTKTVEQRRGELFARECTALMQTLHRVGAMRLSGKHWDRGMSAGHRRATAARDAADAEEEARLPLPAVAIPVVQAFPVG